MLDAYKKHKGSWQAYEVQFMDLLRQRQVEDKLDRAGFANTRTALLCSEKTAEHCHRRLVLEYLNGKWGDVAAVHL